METNVIYNEDCIISMKRMEDKSVDMILCDLPYGTTSCHWDTIIPFEPLWEQYKRIIKDNGAIVLTASQPFTSALVMSNPNMFRYLWTWIKDRPTNPMLAKKQPMRYTEDVVIFYKNQPIYNPQMETHEEKNKRNNTKTFGKKHNTGTLGESNIIGGDGSKDLIYPKNYIKFSRVQNTEHPTQKPVALFEYLIKTYTNENDTVYDGCIGSGTTAIACINTKRNYIGSELDKGYYNIALNRIANAQQTLL